MRGHPKHHWRRQRHDFRLQRALFWWFGITILLACAVSFGVIRLVSPEFHSWRRNVDRVQTFAAGRFAIVWDDPTARRELVQSSATAFNASKIGRASCRGGAQ